MRMIESVFHSETYNHMGILNDKNRNQDINVKNWNNDNNNDSETHLNNNRKQNNKNNNDNNKKKRIRFSHP